MWLSPFYTQTGEELQLPENKQGPGLKRLQKSTWTGFTDFVVRY